MEEMRVLAARLSSSERRSTELLARASELVKSSWHDYALGCDLCDVMREAGAIDVIVGNLREPELLLESARLLEQSLTAANRAHVSRDEEGLRTVADAACQLCECRRDEGDAVVVGVGLLCHLFKLPEEQCGRLIALGALSAVVRQCRSRDERVLRHCASAMANLALHGGTLAHKEMARTKATEWLFPLAFHPDELVRYFACLSAAALASGEEARGAVFRSGVLQLVEPFLSERKPEEMALRVHGQSEGWLRRLVPLLKTPLEPVRSMAAFHVAVEACIKERIGNQEVLKRAGALEPLRAAAGWPNALAADLANDALRRLGEEQAVRLSQRVPLWSWEDVCRWLRQVGFEAWETAFARLRVDGDLLLRLTDGELRDDVGMENGLVRKRLFRELGRLKRLCDYSCCDPHSLASVLSDLGFVELTYPLLSRGVTARELPLLSEEELDAVEGRRLRRALLARTDKTLDAFVSYRRTGGSQLASLLRAHLQLRGFTVFLDVGMQEAGPFERPLLAGVRKARHLLLVLTEGALQSDWVRREASEALRCGCNVIPVTEGHFDWPSDLPQELKSLPSFNGVRWIHDYQDACVDKLEKFMRASE